MVNLKRISSDGIDTALDKADHYRLLNEPLHAESICLDVLEVEPENQRALITLLLALTDQFPTKLYGAFQDAEKLVPQLSDEYDQIYYEGIVNERWASTQLERGTASKSLASWIGRAMRCYERAEELSDGKNPDPILRWNTCVRLQEQIGSSEPVQAPLRRDLHSEYGDDVPPR
jgi:hypothetical protein